MADEKRTRLYETIEELNEQMQVRREKMAAIADLGIEPFGRHYEPTHGCGDIVNNFDALENQEVRIAGRILTIRGHGKASFANLLDMSGKIQIYFRQDVLGEEAYASPSFAGYW